MKLTGLLFLRLGLFIAFCAYPLTGRCENISFESALVWRADGEGDYLLPAESDSRYYTSEPSIETKGRIESVSVTWVADGQVNMEVSADNGLHYSRVVNGVPLASGFTGGTNLRWRAQAQDGARLTSVRISYKDASGVVAGFGQPALSGFKFRKKIHIAGPEKGDLHDYQVKMIVGESEEAAGCQAHLSGHAKQDFSDIRFTLADAETLAAYYLEKVTGEPGRRRAEFFVKIPQIPSEGIDLYVYYGNLKAGSLSDAKSVFDFYDDFKGFLPDSGKWQLRLDPGGSWTAVNDGVILDAAAIISRSFKFMAGIIEYSATAETSYEIRLIIRDADPDSQSDIAQIAYSSGYSGAEHCIAAGDIVKVNIPKRITPLARYDFRVEADKGKIVFERYSPGFGEKQAAAIYRDPEGVQEGYVGLKSSGAGQGRSTARFHWIRVRKHAETEPLVRSGFSAPEEALAPAIFENVTLSSDGSLVLESGKGYGRYVTADIAASNPVRIMAVRWEGNGVSFDVSADGGENYKKDCVNNSYFFSSKGDFVKGSRIRARVSLRRLKNVQEPGLKSMSVQYAPGNIVVLSPNGGEVFSPGGQMQISWTAWDYGPSYPMKIEYSIDAGGSYFPIIEKAANSGVYFWRLPEDDALLTGKALVRISDNFEPGTADTSDATFIIKNSGI